MSLQIIKANPTIRKSIPASDGFLNISEFFCDTIQGEGINAGAPAAFLRMQGCTLDCSYCDTKAIWREGNPYTFTELFELMEQPRIDLIRKLKEGQHLILTGGSPLKQQKELMRFIAIFCKRYRFTPYLEIENECTIFPEFHMWQYINCWNNSPKLSASGNVGYNPELISALAHLHNSWFKFVITSEEDWKEIYSHYLLPKLIRRNQIILMPEGSNFKELEQNRQMVVDICIKNNIRYTSREHLVLWDNRVGV